MKYLEIFMKAAYICLRQSENTKILRNRLKMKVTIPDNIVKLIQKHKNHGDYVSISKRITVSVNPPDGDGSRQNEIRNAIRQGFGEVEIVRAIAEFYTEKQKAVQELNSM